MQLKGRGEGRARMAVFSHCSDAAELLYLPFVSGDCSLVVENSFLFVLFRISCFLKKLETRTKEQEYGSSFLRFLKRFKDFILVDTV